MRALRGTPFAYQGQELGLSDATVPPDRVVDGRDPERAPMPWLRPSVAGPGAGFTTGWSGGWVRLLGLDAPRAPSLEAALLAQVRVDGEGFGGHHDDAQADSPDEVAARAGGVVAVTLVLLYRHPELHQAIRLMVAERRAPSSPQ